MQLQPDTLLQGRYRVVALIAQGGMGAVYRAVDERLGHTVALKQTLMRDPALRAAFEREARLLAGLQHPALPVVSDHFSEGDGQFLVMQFIPGDDLAQLLRRRGGPFPPAEVLPWAGRILDALDYLHAQRPPIIHRDVKPQNLKLTARGEIVLLDFGLAKGLAGDGGTSPSLYGYTPQYAPLEQIQGSGTDARSDLYSLGATLYELLTGAPPPDALTRAAAVVRGDLDPLRPALELNPQLAPRVSHMLGQALALNPDLRPPSAATMRSALSSGSASQAGAGQAQPVGAARPPATGSTLLGQPAMTHGSPATGATIAVAPQAGVAPPPAQIARRRPAGLLVALGIGAALLLITLSALLSLERPGDTSVTATPTGTSVFLAAPTATVPGAPLVGASRASPLPPGSPVPVEGWQVEVLELIRGERAYEMVRKANSTNGPPPAGYEYLLLKLRAISGAEQWAMSRGDVQIIGSRDYAYNGFAAVPPEPLFEASGKVAPGQTIEGWSAYLVSSAELELVLAVGSLITGEARYLALSEGARFEPDRALLEVGPDRVGADWREPAALGEPVITDDWEVTVTEVVRGKAAWQQIFAANSFNDPPPDGMEYVAAFVRARRIADDDDPDLISGGYFSGAAGLEEQDQPAVVAPEPDLNAQLFPGGSAEGWVVVTVPANSPDARLVFRNNTVFFRPDDFNTRYFALN